jgi:hypothetical protein
MDLSRRLVLAGSITVVATRAAPARASIEAWFAPSARLWPRWQANDPASSRRVDHGAWNSFLERHLSHGADGVARLPYARIPPGDRSALESYLTGLSAEPVSKLSRAEQLPFWINLYNALTVAVVLRHYPVASIRDIDISPGLFATGPWDKKLLPVEGEPLSLNDIEHRILRPIWKDPRVHYAVNCASIGCPNLQQEAFGAENAARLLDAGAGAYVNHPRGARVQDGNLAVSSIYIWFKEDFGGTDSGVISHLAGHAEPPLARLLAGVRGIDSDTYDWRLNDSS